MPLEFDLRRDVLLAFVTPIAQLRLDEAEEINPQLAAMIREKAAQDPGQVRSNVGGWHSEDDLLKWPGPAVAALEAGMRQAVDHMMATVTQRPKVESSQTLKAWANLCRAGNYHLPHSHATYHWSGSTMSPQAKRRRMTHKAAPSNSKTRVARWKWPAPRPTPSAAPYPSSRKMACW